MKGPFPRLAVGLGDPDRERRLLPGLSEAEDLSVVERCLNADQLLAAVRSGNVDVVLVAHDLHRLGSGALADLDASRVPRVLLVRDTQEPRWQSQRGVVLPLDAEPNLVRQGIDAALRGEQFHLQPTAPSHGQRPAAPDPVTAAATDEIDLLSVITVASAPGGPGRTTVALNLAAALGAVVPTVVVDADMAGPSLVAHLDADPTRNLYMVAHAEPDAPWEWDRAIESEVQAIDAARSPYGAVLGGIPKPDMRSRINGRFLEKLVTALRRRYRYVILDTGGELLGGDAAAHRAALSLGQQVLLVCSADLVGVWRARTTLTQLESHLQISPQRVALVINRHDPRFHHTRAEIEWALGAATAAVIPYDHLGVERAMAAQRPAVLVKSNAGKAILDLAERVHGGKVALPPEPARSGRRRPRLPRVSLPGWPRSRPRRSVGEEPAA